MRIKILKKLLDTWRRLLFLWQFVFILFFVGAGIGLFFLLSPSQLDVVQEAPKRNTVLVEVEPIKVQRFEENLVAVGNLVANDSVMLRPEIEGKITEILFTPGTHVEKGTSLIKIDDVILRAKVNEAQAQRRLAELDYKRTQLLVEKKVGPIKEMQKAYAAYEVHTAALRGAEKKLEKCLIVAPFGGLVGLTDMSIGSYVRPGEDLVMIEDIDPMKVDFHVGEVYIQDLKVGMPVKVKVDGFPNVYQGLVKAIDARVDTINHSIRVRASIDNASKDLRSGLFASVTLMLKEDETAIMVPESAIEQRKGEQVVYRIIDDKAVETPVVIGSRRDGMVVVEEGLFSYDIVVTAGASKLHFSGVPVRTISSSRMNEKGKDITNIVEKLKQEAK